MRSDYTLGIAIPDGYHWDGSRDNTKNLSSVWAAQRHTNPPDWGWDLQGDPFVDLHTLKVTIDIGAGVESPIGGYGHIYMQARAHFLPDWPPQ